MGKKIRYKHLGGNILGGDSKTFYPMLWEYLIKEFSVKSVLDIGCGEGWALTYFRLRGVGTMGIDGLSRNVDRCKNLHNKAKLIDFSKEAFLSKWTFDLGWCCELVEHVEEEYVQNIIDSFKCCRYVAMTHALPRQGGYHHVNCRPSDYWISLMDKNGFDLLKEKTEFARKLRCEPYFAKSGLIFKNEHLSDRPI